jgi:hypothetical protein
MYENLRCWQSSSALRVMRLALRTSQLAQLQYSALAPYRVWMLLLLAVALLVLQLQPLSTRQAFNVTSKLLLCTVWLSNVRSQHHSPQSTCYCCTLHCSVHQQAAPG